MKALLKILEISVSNPPTPISLKLNPNLVKALAFITFEEILRLLLSEAKSIFVSSAKNPKLTKYFFPPSFSFKGPSGSISNSEASILNRPSPRIKNNTWPVFIGVPAYFFLIISIITVSSNLRGSSLLSLKVTLNLT